MPIAWFKKSFVDYCRSWNGQIKDLYCIPVTQCQCSVQGREMNRKETRLVCQTLFVQIPFLKLLQQSINNPNILNIFNISFKRVSRVSHFWETMKPIDKVLPSYIIMMSLNWAKGHQKMENKMSNWFKMFLSPARGRRG